MKAKKLEVCFVFLVLFSAFIITAKINLQNQSSIIQIDSGSTFVTTNSILGLQGTVHKEDGATIEGAILSFNKGVFQDGENKTNLTGGIDPNSDFDFILDGNKLFSPVFGQIVKKLKISGKNNKVEGQPNVIGDIVLEDNDSDLIYAINGRINSNVVLNGGTIYLEQDLIFGDDKLVTGSGIVVFNGRKVQLGNTAVTWSDPIFFDSGSDLTLNANVMLSETWTFSGNSIIQGNNQILSLETGGEIVIEPNSTLLIKNLVINNVHGSNIRCLDATSSLELQNVIMFLADDYLFSEGNFVCFYNVKISGNGWIFAYQSDQQSMVAANTQLILDQNLTFSYDPKNGLQNMLTFEDETSAIILDGATFHVTGTGISLQDGSLVVASDSSIVTEDSQTGITLGTGLAQEDCVVKISVGSTLRVKEGALNYKNVGVNSFMMGNSLATLHMSDNTTLRLYENLDIGNGIALFGDNTAVLRATGKSILGAVLTEGELTFGSL